MFEPRPYFEDADGIRRPRRVRFIEGKDFDKFLDELFKEIDVDKIIRRRLNTIQRPRVSICVPDEDDEEVSITPSKPDPRTIPHGYVRVDETDLSKFPKPEIVDLNKKSEDGEKKPTFIFDDNDFKKLFGNCVGTKKFNEIFGLDENGKPDPKYGDLDEDDDEDDEDGLDEGDAYEDDEPANVPPSIFDMLKSGKEFKDIVSTQPKHDEANIADDGEAVQEAKNPFVFIANRLTFLIQTMFPIVFDTSMIDTEENSITIGVNQEKTYPKLGTIDDIGFITSEINRANAIQQEIGEYLGDTEFINIYCFPSTIIDERHDKIQMAVKFVIYKKRKLINF